jgi:hypothetical protein
MGFWRKDKGDGKVKYDDINPAEHTKKREAICDIVGGLCGIVNGVDIDRGNPYDLFEDGGMLDRFYLPLKEGELKKSSEKAILSLANALQLWYTFSEEEVFKPTNQLYDTATTDPTKNTLQGRYAARIVHASGGVPNSTKTEIFHDEEQGIDVPVYYTNYRPVHAVLDEIAELMFRVILASDHKKMKKVLKRHGCEKTEYHPLIPQFFGTNDENVFKQFNAEYEFILSNHGYGPRLHITDSEGQPVAHPERTGFWKETRNLTEKLRSILF